MTRVSKQRESVKLIESAGGTVVYAEDLGVDPWDENEQIGDRPNPRHGPLRSFGRKWAGADFVDHVGEVSLKYLTVGKAQIEALSALCGLECLLLDQSSVGDADLKLIARCHSLRQLSLARTGVTDKGMSHLAQLSELRYLDISDTSVGDDGASALAVLSKLREVRLNATHVSDAGAMALAQIHTLRYMEVAGSAVTIECRRKLQLQFPGLTIEPVGQPEGGERERDEGPQFDEVR